MLIPSADPGYDWLLARGSGSHHHVRWRQLPHGGAGGRVSAAGRDRGGGIALCVVGAGRGDPARLRSPHGVGGSVTGARVGVTQRVEHLADRDERRDRSTRRGPRGSARDGDLMIPIPNCSEDVVAFVRDLAIDVLLFSGGNDLGPRPPTLATRTRTRRHGTRLADVRHRGRSAGTRGVSRDADARELLGRPARSGRSTTWACPTRSSACSRHGDCARGPVNSFHDWGLAPYGVGATLEVPGHCAHGSVEAVAHRTLPAGRDHVAPGAVPPRIRPTVNCSLGLVERPQQSCGGGPGRRGGDSTPTVHARPAQVPGRTRRSVTAGRGKWLCRAPPGWTTSPSSRDRADQIRCRPAPGPQPALRRHQHGPFDVCSRRVPRGPTTC